MARPVPMDKFIARVSRCGHGGNAEARPGLGPTVRVCPIFARSTPLTRSPRESVTEFATRSARAGRAASRSDAGWR